MALALSLSVVTSLDPSYFSPSSVDSSTVVLDEKMQRLHRIIDEIRHTSIPVLLIGETGCGKEVLAERIHQRSARCAQPFIRINCAGLSESVVESELFGHERGSFTGAHQSHRGIFEAAHTGTLMLDELGELPLRTQAKLLRVLESGELTRLGSSQARRVDVRVVAATHRTLPALIESGQFRRDLYYRLCGAELSIPALRERQREILPLARYFLQRFAESEGRRAPTLDAAAEARLIAHRWPGNVRELRNVVEYAAARCADGVIRAELLELRAEAPSAASSTPPAAPASSGSALAASGLQLREQLSDFERQCICAALQRCRANQTSAARELGISRRALTRKLTKYGIERPRSIGVPRPTSRPDLTLCRASAGSDE